MIPTSTAYSSQSLNNALSATSRFQPRVASHLAHAAGTNWRENFIRVWLLCNDAPCDGIKTSLILFDVELPIAIEVSREIDSSELDDSLRHLLGPAHAGALHPIFDQVLARAFDRATGDRPAAGEVFVIAHSGAVSVKVTGTVWDAEGHALARAAIQVTNVRTGMSYKAASSDAGRYTFAQLPAGAYELSAFVPGMLPYQRLDISLPAAETLRI